MKEKRKITKLKKSILMLEFHDFIEQAHMLLNDVKTEKELSNFLIKKLYELKEKLGL